MKKTTTMQSSSGFIRSNSKGIKRRLPTMQRYLNLGLDILDGVAGLHLQGDRLARQGLDEDLHDEQPKERDAR